MLLKSWVEYVFIDGDETASAWFLLNTVLNDPLHLFIYCDCVNHDRAVTRVGAIPPHRRIEYLPIDAVDYLANSLAACIGQMHVCVPETDVDDCDGQSDSDRQSKAAAKSSAKCISNLIRTSEIPIPIGAA